ncbi:MAG: DUF4249 domain-containing protein [Bacteroidota bacterium]|nr:DUF4249 domain-containing protein [Bacteroidota bacterium]
MTNSGKENLLKLSRTTPSSRVLQPVRDASIKIVDDSGREENYFPRNDLGEGIYQHSGNIVKGIPGVTYYIEIELVDGNVYRSTPETMPFLNAIDAPYFDYDIIKEENEYGNFVSRSVVRLYTNTTIESQNGALFLKWNIEEAYKFTPTDYPDPFGNIPPPCYIVSPFDPQEIFLFDMNLSKSNEIKGMNSQPANLIMHFLIFIILM